MAYARPMRTTLRGYGDLNCFGEPETPDVGSGDAGFQSWLATGIASPPGPYATKAKDYAAEYGTAEALLYFNTYVRSGRPDVCSRGGGVTVVGANTSGVTYDRPTGTVTFTPLIPGTSTPSGAPSTSAPITDYGYPDPNAGAAPSGPTYGSDPQQLPDAPTGGSGGSGSGGGGGGVPGGWFPEDEAPHDGQEYGDNQPFGPTYYVPDGPSSPGGPAVVVDNSGLVKVGLAALLLVPVLLSRKGARR